MNFDINALSERFLPWARDNWEALVAGLVILILALYLRKLLGGSRRPATAPVAPQKPDTQALDVSTAAAAEITADIEAYARALFTEDVGLIASRAPPTRRRRSASRPSPKRPSSMTASSCATCR